MTTRKDLRRQMRRRRKGVAPDERRRAARALAAGALRSILLTRAQHFTCFLSADGEIDTSVLIAKLHRMRRTVWLPCLGKPKLRFRRFDAKTPLKRGAFNILEPASGPFRSAKKMSVILTPLVAFDASGQRLGMGGGYYDRTFAHRLQRKAYNRPKLIGVAFSIQEAPNVPSDHWDVPLDGILTEQGLKLFRKGI